MSTANSINCPFLWLYMNTTVNTHKRSSAGTMLNPKELRTVPHVRQKGEKQEISVNWVLKIVDWSVIVLLFPSHTLYPDPKINQNAGTHQK